MPRRTGTKFVYSDYVYVAPRSRPIVSSLGVPNPSAFEPMGPLSPSNVWLTRSVLFDSHDFLATKPSAAYYHPTHNR
jgi:hypothetical protein